MVSCCADAECCNSWQIRRKQYYLSYIISAYGVHSHPMHSNIILLLFSETVQVCDIKSIELDAYILSGINIEWLRMEG
jgi:hypothetical protein